MHNPGVARWSTSRLSTVALLMVALVASQAPVVLAVGDPASDYLIANQVFLTSQSATASPSQRHLLAMVRAANRAGFSVRVAVISSEYDLGSITALWRKPSIYARFLGLELSSAYRRRLLVVMPDGFGFNWPGHSAAPAYRLLAGVALGAGGDGLAVAAQAAVRRLAASSGVTLAPSQLAAGSGLARSAGADLPAILGAALVGLAAVAALAVLVRRARRRRLVRQPRSGRAVSWRGLPVGLRWAIPAVAVLFAGVVALSIAALRRSSPGVSAASLVTPPPFTWPRGERRAPNFTLCDQDGRPVSIRAYLRRPVIVTFIDPLCRNLCPLEAQVLNQAERQLPASQRPMILAVSVDVYSSADSRANLLQTFREWHLVPQWRWAVGRPSQLAAAWRRYEIGVSVVTKRIGKTAIHYITHTEAAYIIDPTGHERALFLWPFYPQDVERELHRLA
jgi:cytochrome oxidase Cu insertion factor (SCO1/SenC/PrrC family)